ncbi:MAG: tetratricopeptide repeat protein [Planctomycetaceae bacterium]
MPGTLFNFRIALLWISLLFPAEMAWGLDHQLARFTADLRRQELYSLAESYCQQRLDDDRLAPALRIQLTVELAETFALHASVVPAENQQSLYQKANELVGSFPLADLNELEQLYLEVAAKTLHMTEGETAYWHSELLQTEEARTDALMLLTEAIAGAQELIDSNRQWASARMIASSETDSQLLNYQEILMLHRQFRLEFARALLRKAQLTRELHQEIELATDVENSIPELSTDFQTSTKLINAFQKQHEFPALYYQSHLLEADWELLTGRYQNLDKRLEMLKQRDPGVSILNEIAAREARRELQLNNVVKAAKLLHQHQQAGYKSTPEVDFLTIKAFLELARIAAEKKEEQLETRLMENIQARLVVMPKGYWSERARRMFARKEQQINYGTDLQQLIQQAEMLNQEGKLDEASAAYSNALEKAIEREAAPLQAELKYQLGLILYKQKNFDQAAEQFQNVASEFPEEKIAPQSDLMLAYIAGQKGEIAKAIEILRKHRQTYPESETYLDATRLLANLEQQQKELITALYHYRELIEREPEELGTRDKLLEVYEELSHQENISPALAEDLLKQFSGDFPDPLEPLTAENFDRQFRIRLLLSELKLHVSPIGQSELSDILNPLLEPSITSSPRFQRHQTDFVEIYSRYLILTDITREQFDTLTDLPVELKLALFRIIAATPTDKPSYHSLMEILERQLEDQKAELSPEMERLFSFMVMMRKYREDDSETNLQNLAQAEQKLKLSIEELRQIALLLTSSKQKSRQQAALEHWESLEARLKAGSDSWFESRYYQIQSLQNLGQSAEAVKRKRLTLLLHQFPQDSPGSRSLIHFNRKSRL